MPLFIIFPVLALCSFQTKLVTEGVYRLPSAASVCVCVCVCERERFFNLYYCTVQVLDNNILDRGKKETSFLISISYSSIQQLVLQNKGDRFLKSQIETHRQGRCPHWNGLYNYCTLFKHFSSWLYTVNLEVVNIYIWWKSYFVIYTCQLKVGITMCHMILQKSFWYPDLLLRDHFVFVWKMKTLVLLNMFEETIKC